MGLAENVPITRFQSTHSLRSATCTIPACRNGHAGFNPRTPCGVRPLREAGLPCASRFQSTHSLRSATFLFLGGFPPFDVSIHALLAECDPSNSTSSLSSRLMFQSTHSLRSATIWPVDISVAGIVSIHALLAECDRPASSVRFPGAGFNPRTPCGVRQVVRASRSRVRAVSIHALLAECDTWVRLVRLGRFGFNPRTPCGVRQTD